MSGAVSTSSRVPASLSTTMLARVRRLRGSAGSQAPQSPLPSAPPISRHAGGTARAEQDDPHRAQAALRNRRRKFSVVRSASASGSRPRTSASTRGGMRDIGRLVALAAERHRREIRRVGLHQQTIGWKIAGDLPEFSWISGKSGCRRS